MVSLEIIALVLTGLSITASIIYYANILSNANRTQRQQLETRQAQFLLNLSNTFSSTEFRRQWHTLWHVEWNDFDDFKEKYHGKDVEVMSAYTSMITYYDHVGVLVKTGLIDIEKVYLLLAGGIKITWERFMPLMIGDRDEFKDYALENRKRWENFEYLYNEIIKYDRQHPELAT